MLPYQSHPPGPGSEPAPLFGIAVRLLVEGVHSSHESSHGGCLGGVLTSSDLEPVSGFEPLTCRLQEVCSQATPR